MKINFISWVPDDVQETAGLSFLKDEAMKGHYGFEWIQKALKKAKKMDGIADGMHAVVNLILSDQTVVISDEDMWRGQFSENSVYLNAKMMDPDQLDEGLPMMVLSIICDEDDLETIVKKLDAEVKHEPDGPITIMI